VLHPPSGVALVNDSNEVEAETDPRLLTWATARRQTLSLLHQADEAFAAYSCPATAECCQLRTTGRPPWLWPVEWALLTEHFRNKNQLWPPERSDGACPFLDAQGRRCTVYAQRPFGCRTFFCGRAFGPPRQPVEAVDLLQRRLADLSARTFGEEAAPRPLMDWFRKVEGPTS
jgi:uncharacterized protein